MERELDSLKQTMIDERERFLTSLKEIENQHISLDRYNLSLENQLEKANTVSLKSKSRISELEKENTELAEKLMHKEFEVDQLQGDLGHIQGVYNELLQQQNR